MPALPDLSTCLAGQISAELDGLTEPYQAALRHLLAALYHAGPCPLEASLAGWLASELPHETIERYQMLRQLIALVGELKRESQP
jgi:hypothetical protein